MIDKKRIPRNYDVFFVYFRMPEYATRACFMSTEALKARGMYADAAFEFIKLTNEVECVLFYITVVVLRYK